MSQSNTSTITKQSSSTDLLVPVMGMTFNALDVKRNVSDSTKAMLFTQNTQDKSKIMDPFTSLSKLLSLILGNKMMVQKVCEVRYVLENAGTDKKTLLSTLKDMMKKVRAMAPNVRELGDGSGSGSAMKKKAVSVFPQ